MCFVSILCIDGISSMTALVLIKLRCPNLYFLGIFVHGGSFLEQNLWAGVCLCKYSCSNGLGMWEPRCHLCSWKNGSDATGDSHQAQVKIRKKILQQHVEKQAFLQSIQYLIILGCEL